MSVDLIEVSGGNEAGPSAASGSASAAAYQTDSRDRERHLQGAALLVAVVEDPYVTRGYATQVQLAPPLELVLDMTMAPGEVPGPSVDRI